MFIQNFQIQFWRILSYQIGVTSVEMEVLDNIMCLYYSNILCRKGLKVYRVITTFPQSMLTHENIFICLHVHGCHLDSVKREFSIFIKFWFDYKEGNC